MKIRVLTGIVMALIGIPLLCFSEYIVYPIAAALLSLGAVFELLRAMKHHDRLLLAIPAYALAFCMPLGAYIWIRMASMDPKEYLLLCSLAFVVFLLYLMFVAVLAQGQIPFADIACVFAAALYTVTSFTALTVLRYLKNGLALLILVLVCAWMCDIFAYFTGSLIGRHKLVERLSPKKTVEGAIGGVVFATLGCLLYGVLLPYCMDVTPNFIILAVCGVTLSVVAQIGDLFASLIKRESGVKDYGKLFPGHGGVLDRFDSILSVACVLLIISLIAPPIV